VQPDEEQADQSENKSNNLKNTSLILITKPEPLKGRFEPELEERY
jgi:hypothetical protein